MTALPFASLNYGRDGYGLPESRLVNMFPEATISGPGPSARLPRPGLQQAYSLGTAGIRGLYQQDGAFNGDVFAVAGTSLYRGTELLGTVALGALARWAASYTQLALAIGGVAYAYDGDTLAQVTIPDGQLVADVFTLGGRFYWVIAGSDVWYYSSLDDATTVNALSFATADAAPDATVGAAVLGSRAVFLARTSIEFWQLTGDPDAPLVREQGSSYSKGCAAQGSIVYADNRLFCVGSDLKIYAIGGGVPQRVSDHSVEQKLRECMAPDSITGFGCTWDGHEFVVYNVPGQGSWAMHVESGEWLEWTSHGRTTFRCSSGIIVGATCYLGDTDTGTIYTLADVFTDDGDPIEFIASATAPAGPINVLHLDCATGVGLEDNTDPVVEMRYSTDMGRTFTAWRPASLGLVGDYARRVRWRNLGFSRKARQIEFRTTSPVRAVYAGVRVNE
jgi:hypothetical protein